MTNFTYFIDLHNWEREENEGKTEMEILWWTKKRNNVFHNDFHNIKKEKH